MPIMPWASPSWPTSLEATGNVVAGVFCVLRNYNSCQPLRSPFLLCRLRLQLRGGGGGGDGTCSWRDRLRRDKNYPSQQAGRQRSLKRRQCLAPQVSGMRSSQRLREGSVAEGLLLVPSSHTTVVSDGDGQQPCGTLPRQGT